MVGSPGNKQRGRSRLLRTDVTKSLAQQPLDRSAAESRLSLERGAFNISPWGFAAGFLGALVGLLFALHAAIEAHRAQEQRDRGKAVPTASSQSAPASTWIDVEVE